MARDVMTDEQVQMECEILKQSEFVKLAQKEIRLKNRQRQWLYQLRSLERRGKQLSAMGITSENIEEEMFSDIPADIGE